MAEQQKKDDKAAGASSTGTAKQPQPNLAGRDIPSLGALDEDDEFEEFEAQGGWQLLVLGSVGSVVSLFFEGDRLADCFKLLPRSLRTDWDDADTSLAHLGNETGGGAAGLSISGAQQGGTGDHLWEDNWDDDDVEDDFGKALR